MSGSYKRTGDYAEQSIDKTLDELGVDQNIGLCEADISRRRQHREVVTFKNILENRPDFF